MKQKSNIICQGYQIFCKNIPSAQFNILSFVSSAQYQQWPQDVNGRLRTLLGFLTTVMDN